MKLAFLLHDIAPVADQTEISGLSLHSQQLTSGELFIALKGSYIQDAIARGASAVLCEAQYFQKQDDTVPVIPVQNLADKLDTLITRFYGDTNAALEVIGITGTNGKTTTAYLLAQALSHLGQTTGILGTLGYGFVNNLTDFGLTTPDALSLQKYFMRLKAQGAKTIAMEVSSHGLDQNRVKHIAFESALFTNLTQDHMDYHQNMEAYGKAKQKLFEFSSLKRAIVNADDSYAPKILAAISPTIPTVLYTQNPQLPEFTFVARANVYVITTESVKLDPQGIQATVHTPWGQGLLRSPLLGAFNLSNLLGVLAELCLRGIALENALDALLHATAPPGRMQHLGGGSAPHVIIDYAHTPDALENALQAARAHCHQRLWCVFGCGGDRDPDKRAKMGHIAGRLADQIVITNDNPRTENPQKIITQILQGVVPEHRDKITVEEDRLQAIQYALDHASPLDTIVVAGKGHENMQIIGHEKYPFNDAQSVQNILGNG